MSYILISSEGLSQAAKDIKNTSLLDTQQYTLTLKIGLIYSNQEIIFTLAMRSMAYVLQVIDLKGLPKITGS